MKRQRRPMRALKTLAASLGLLALTVACGETGGEGNLNFRNLDSTSDFALLPIADGRTATYEVRSTGFSNAVQTIEVATVRDNDTAGVTGFEGGQVTVEARGTGSTVLDVTTTKGTRDYIDLEVRTEAKGYFRVGSLNAAESPQIGLIDIDGKYNLKPADSLILNQPLFTDAEGRRLSGSGGHVLSVDEASGDMSVTPEDGSSVTIEAGADGDTAVLTHTKPGAGGSGRMDLRATEGYSPDSLQATLVALLTNKSVEVGDTVRMGSDVSVIRIVALDADGYEYTGSHTMDATVSIPSGAPISAVYAGVTEDGSTDSDYCVDEGADGCIEWEGLPQVAFMLTRDNDTPSTFDIEIETGGYTGAITVVLQ